MPGPERRREILELVASGEVTPEEAAELLSQLDPASASAARASTDPAGAGQPPGGSRSVTVTELRVHREPADPSDASADADADADEPAPEPLGDPDRVVTVRVRSNCRAVSIVGDPEVLTAVAEGDHAAHVDGDTLTIEATLDRSPGFAFLRSPGLRTKAMVRLGPNTVRPLTVRMNPDLALDSQVDAGSMTIRNVRGPIRAHTSAGALRVDGFESPIVLRVAAGSATAHGRMASGSSRIECDAGKVTVRLTPDSSVKIRGRVSLGQLNAPDTIGGGEADLEIVANLGSVDVGLDTDDDADDGDGDEVGWGAE